MVVLPFVRANLLHCDGRRAFPKLRAQVLLMERLVLLVPIPPGPNLVFQSRNGVFLICNLRCRVCELSNAAHCNPCQPLPVWIRRHISSDTREIFKQRQGKLKAQYTAWQVGSCTAREI